MARIIKLRVKNLLFTVIYYIFDSGVVICVYFRSC